VEFDRKTILTEVVVKQSLQREGGGLRRLHYVDTWVPAIIAVVSGDTTRPKVH